MMRKKKLRVARVRDSSPEPIITGRLCLRADKESGQRAHPITMGDVLV
jgi:hypothetical protein